MDGCFNRRPVLHLWWLFAAPAPIWFLLCPQRLANDVDLKMEARIVPAHLLLQKSQFSQSERQDLWWWWCRAKMEEQRGLGPTSVSAQRGSTAWRKIEKKKKKRRRRENWACSAGFTREWTLHSPSQPAALLALGQEPHTHEERGHQGQSVGGCVCVCECVVFWVGPYLDASGQAATLSECLHSLRFHPLSFHFTIASLWCWTP